MQGSYMESDLQIIIKGIEEELATDIGNAVSEAIKAFKQVDNNLDIRRMHRIILPADFSGELAALSGETASGAPITHTNEEYAIAVAKVLLLPRDSGYEIVLVINANVAADLAPKSKEGYKAQEFLTVLHLLHHELCHVHDENKKIDALNGIILRHSYKGKDMHIRPLAELCWSEYIANFLSSSTAQEHWISIMTESLSDAIERTKRKIDRKILEYRTHSDLDKLLNQFHRHGGYLLRVAAHTLGYIDGLNKPLEKLSEKAFKSLSGSYFESTWESIQVSLRQMRHSYPDGWVDIEIYNNLADAIENYFGEMGFYLSSTEDGQAYVDIPLKPETTPNF